MATPNVGNRMPRRSNASEAASLFGAHEAQAARAVWSRRALLFAYISLVLLAFFASLESQATVLLAPYATSHFGAHSFLTGLGVIQGVITAVVKPPMVFAFATIVTNCTGQIVHIRQTRKLSRLHHPDRN